MSAPLPLPPLTAKTQIAIAPQSGITTSLLLIQQSIDALTAAGLTSPCLEHRRELIARSHNNPAVQAQLIAAATADPAQWVMDWAWTSDPRRNPSVLPLALFPKQVEYLHWRQASPVRKRARPD